MKKLKVKYPELYEQAQSAKNKEDYIMFELGAKRCTEQVILDGRSLMDKNNGA